MAIRGWQVSESTIAGWNNTGIYLFDPGSLSTTLVNSYSPATTSMAVYEVTYIEDQGSWLLATVGQSQTPAGWLNLGGVENLQVTGDQIPTQVNGEQVVRPKVLYWWVPSATLATVTIPAVSYEGTIVGTLPVYPPTSTPPSDQIQVERTANGVILTVPPTSSETTIQVTVGS